MILQIQIAFALCSLGGQLCLPFYGAVYSFNGQNFYASRYRNSDPPWRKMGRWAFKSRWITPALRREFGIRPVQVESTSV